jgi:uncharacterized membrane protein YkvA (DUF1232 family)
MKRFLAQPLYNFFRKLIRNPKYRWLVLAGGLVYLISPLDISPDVLPVLGWLDDGMVATLLITEVSQMLIDRRNAQRNKQTTTAANSFAADSLNANQTIDVNATV